MTIRARTPYRTGVLVLVAGALLPVIASAQTPQASWDSGKWQYAASIYAYLPTIGGKTTFPADSAGSGINITSDKILENLKFTFMGSFDVHNGRWGAFTDVVYIDVGGSKSQNRDFTIGNIGLPASTTADLDYDLKGWLWTLAGEYRVSSDPALKMDVLAGARLLDVKQKLGWAISGDLGPIAAGGRSGSAEVNTSVWDAIVGVKGRYSFAESGWSVPFYLDVGTGQSDLTWQGAVGIGYAFRWGEVNALWRYLDYKFKSGNRVEDMNFNGPQIGATFRW